MAVVTPPPGGSYTAAQFPRIPPAAWLLLIPIVGLLGVCYWWMVQRIEVPAGQVLVLVHKVGEPLPLEAEGQVVLSPSLLASLGEPPDSTRAPGAPTLAENQGGAHIGQDAHQGSHSTCRS